MKRIILSIAILLSASFVFGQSVLKEFKYPLKGKMAKSIKVILTQEASVYIEDYDGDELIVQAINKANGQVDTSGRNKLKNVTQQIKKTPAQIEQSITPTVRETNTYAEFHFPFTSYRAISIRIPKGMNFALNFGTSLPGSEISVKGIAGDLNLMGKAPLIKVDDIKGLVNIVVQGTNNSSVVKLTNIHLNSIKTKGSQHPAIYVSTGDSDIDVSIDADTKALFSVKNSNGGVYVDKLLKAEETLTTNKSYAIKLNGGGMPVFLNTEFGKIFIRKQ